MLTSNNLLFITYNLFVFVFWFFSLWDYVSLRQQKNVWLVNWLFS